MIDEKGTNLPRARYNQDMKGSQKTSADYFLTIK